jgi:hypothetical protein
MHAKTIKITFNNDHFLDSRKIIWAFSNKKAIKIYTIFTIWAILLLGIDFLNKSNKTSIESGIIYGYLFYMLLSWLGLLERRIKFLRKGKLWAKRFEKESIECRFMFLENELEYQDKEKLYKLNWSLFNPYIIFKDTILLTTKDTRAVLFSIGKNEIDEDNYSELCDILNEKIGFDKVLK